MSEKFSVSKKAYFLSIVIRKMKELDDKEFYLQSKLIIENCIRKYEGAETDQYVVCGLEDAYSQVDHTLKSRESSYEITMKNIGISSC